MAFNTGLCKFIISILFLSPALVEAVSYHSVKPGYPVSGEFKDSIPVQQLQEVNIRSARPSTGKATSPLQILQGEELSRLNALQVSDALKYFSGVQVKDYGGLGGLKTVSIRSMGANYTAVLYDGIAVNDYQTGQIDLGRYSLENVDMISLNTGESDNIFRTAREQASAGALNITTRKPHFNSGERIGINGGIRGGSFGFFNPFISWDHQISRNFHSRINAEWSRTDGGYPFKQTIGNGDSTATRKRFNSDVEVRKLEGDIWGKFSNSGQLSLKVSGYNSDRGLPGSAIYNNDYTKDRAKEENYFTQANYKQSLSKKIDFQANARFSYSHSYYLDVNNAQQGGKQENKYIQREYYLNAIFSYKPFPELTFSWANDGSYGNFSNNFEDCVFPSRTTWLSAISGRYENNLLTISASLLSNYTHETVRTGIAPDDKFRLSPYLGVSIKPLADLPLRIRGFYKNTYRLPTFSDMYYSRVSRPGLKPENANQLNAGLSWVSEISDLIPYLSFTADGYWYNIKNKIVAVPTGDMFILTVRNYGKTEIKGIDLNMNSHIRAHEKIRFRVSGSYTWQNVQDKSDPQEETYNQQLIYTPQHTVSGVTGILTPWIDLSYHFIFCSKRYFSQVQNPLYLLPSYSEHGASLSRKFSVKKAEITLLAECINLFDKQYEIVRSYPMPGRQWRAGIKINFQN